MPEILELVVKYAVTWLFLAVAVTACLRFPFGLVPYAAGYFLVSCWSLVISIAGRPDLAWTGLALAGLVSLFVIWKTRKQRLTVEKLPTVVWFVLSASLLHTIVPAHDPDSMNLHLGFPQQILEKGVWFEAPGWITQRMAGMGEWFALSGLSSGFDNLQALAQLGALLLFSSDVSKMLRDRKASAWFAVATISLPVLLFLLPSQKPMLIGSLAVAWSAAALLLRVPVSPIAGLFLGCFAISIKHSFLLTAALPAFFWFMNGIRKSKATKDRLLTVLAAGTVLPLWVWNTKRWGDPLSPILTDKFGLGDGWLKGYVQDFNLGFVFPLNLLMPNGLSQIGAFLGPAVLLFLVLLVCSDFRTRVALIAATFLGLLLPGEARFYTEFALVGIIGTATLVPDQRFFPGLRATFTIGAILIGAGIFWSAIPRIKTFWRDGSVANFHKAFTHEAMAINWAHERTSALPDITNCNSRYLLKPETAGVDLFWGWERNRAFLAASAKDTLIVLLKEDDDYLAGLQKHFELSFVDSADFTRITRNPFNRKRDSYRIFLARLKPTP